MWITVGDSSRGGAHASFVFGVVLRLSNTAINTPMTIKSRRRLGPSTRLGSFRYEPVSIPRRIRCQTPDVSKSNASLPHEVVISSEPRSRRAEVCEDALPKAKRSALVDTKILALGEWRIRAAIRRSPRESGGSRFCPGANPKPALISLAVRNARVRGLGAEVNRRGRRTINTDQPEPVLSLILVTGNTACGLWPQRRLRRPRGFRLK